MTFTGELILNGNNYLCPDMAVKEEAAVIVIFPDSNIAATTDISLAISLTSHKINGEVTVHAVNNTPVMFTQ